MQWRFLVTIKFLEFTRKNSNLLLLKNQPEMLNTNAVILRPRFKIEIQKPQETLIELFDNSKSTQSNFIVSCIDDHVFIKFSRHKQHIWSPQLHLEVIRIDEKSCALHGYFGPNPSVWTFFMFLHFLVAGLFIAFSVWAYTNWSLKSGYAIQLSLMLLMLIIWFALYFAGSIGKASGRGEMLELKQFMNEILNL